MLDAGLSRDTLYDTLRIGVRAHRLRATIDSMAATQRAGGSLSDAMERAGGAAFPHHDTLAVRSAERVGAAPDALRELSEVYERRRAARREPRLRALYAVLLLHLAVVAPSVGALVSQPWSALGHILGVLVPLDALLVGAWLASARPPRAPAAARLLLHLPFLGSTIVRSEYRAYWSSLHRLYAAGVPLPRAGHDALASVANAGFRERLSLALEPLEHGKPLGDALARFPALNPQIRAMLTSAEPVGELEAALLQAALMSAEAEDESRKSLAQLTATILYLGAALYVAARLARFYDEYQSYLSIFDS